MDIFNGVLRIVFIGMIVIGALALGTFIKRYLNILITFWGGIFVFLSLGSFVFYIVDIFKRPGNADDFFLGYGLAMGLLGLISILRNNPRLTGRNKNPK